MTPEPADESDDRPWTEAQWEKLMRESDARSAKFGELIETLHDHPDRDEIISREMGWDRDDGEGEGEGEDAAEPPAVFVDESPDEEAMSEVRRSHDELQQMPVYARSYEWAMTVWQALEQDDTGAGEDLVELLGEAIGGAMQVGTKIAGGHGMGYDDDALCGNIVRCKRALEAADESLRALDELREKGHFPPETIAPLIEEGREVRGLVEAWIAELRGRVWWE